MIKKCKQIKQREKRWKEIDFNLAFNLKHSKENNSNSCVI